MRWWLAALVACGGGERTFILEGTVLEVTGPTEILVDHEAVPGFMSAMVMPLAVESEAMTRGLRPGDRIVARLAVGERGSVLRKLRVTGHQEPSGVPVGVEPVRPGSELPAVDIAVGSSEVWRVGAGQGTPTVLAFLYTTCPMPEFCPATVRRLQGLQAALCADASGPCAGARLVSVTIDPEHDSREVLDAFSTSVGARADVWRFGWLERAALEGLLGRAALGSMTAEGKINHAVRFLVLDASGRLIERYDDNRWPQDRVVSQLRSGGPPAPPDSDGTVTLAP